MTKAQIKKELQAAIDKKHAGCKANILSMNEQAHNPQFALMIEKNKGYMMALEDITEMLYSIRIF